MSINRWWLHLSCDYKCDKFENSNELNSVFTTVNLTDTEKCHNTLVKAKEIFKGIQNVFTLHYIIHISISDRK